MATRSERKRKVVVAAADMLIDVNNFDWVSGLTFNKLSAATGIDGSQVSKDFSSDTIGGKQGLVEELVQFLLHPTMGPAATDVEGFFDELEALARDPEKDLEQVIEAWAEGLKYIANVKGMLYKEMLLWGLSNNDKALEAMFEKLFKSWSDRGRIIFANYRNKLVESEGIERHTNFSTTDLVTALVGLTIGLGIVGSTSEALLPTNLHKRTVDILVRAWLGPESVAVLDLANVEDDISVK